MTRFLLSAALVLTWASCTTVQAKSSGQGCTGIPLLQAAWKLLPADVRFPCDPEHLVIIADYAAFLKEHPGIAADPALREKGRHAFAFAISESWPIYINLDAHRAIMEAYQTQPGIAAVIAGVLAHERCHATGIASEADALRVELQLDRQFGRDGLLPPAFDLSGLERQARSAR